MSIIIDAKNYMTNINYGVVLSCYLVTALIMYECFLILLRKWIFLINLLAREDIYSFIFCTTRTVFNIRMHLMASVLASALHSAFECTTEIASDAKQEHMHSQGYIYPHASLEAISKSKT